MAKDVPIRILMVEDNEGDIRLTQEIFADAGLANELIIARNGLEALEILGFDIESPVGELRPTNLPDLIAIDLNLPKLDGRELLDILKRDITLRTIPVIIMTNSLADRHITVSHMLQAKAYIEKPLDVTALVEALQSYNDSFGFVITKGKQKKRV